MTSSKKNLNTILKRTLLTSALLIPGLLLTGCPNPASSTNPTGDGNSSDGNVSIEGKVYSEGQARNAVQCYKNSSNNAAKQIGGQYETTLNAAVTLKSSGLNVQYEQTLSGLIQAMLLFDRTNNEVNCLS